MNEILECDGDENDRNDGNYDTMEDSRNQFDKLHIESDCIEPI